MPPREKNDILYRRSCILEHFKAYFEGFLKYFAALPRRKMYSFLNVNSRQKNKVKDN